MNRDKWKNPEIPLGVLVAKLGEENGEVANAYADAYEVWNDDYKDGVPDDLAIEIVAHMIEELKHVEFIARELRKRYEFGGVHLLDLEWA